MSSQGTVDKKLTALGIELPNPDQPVAAYVMHATSGKTLFLSGHLGKPGGSLCRGKLGESLSTAQGQLAARAAAISLIATLKSAVGDLDRIRIVKVLSLVNSTPDYTEQHLVTNAASELFVEVFGAHGVHARSAFGVASLPLGAAVEIELTAERLDD